MRLVLLAGLDELQRLNFDQTNRFRPVYIYLKPFNQSFILREAILLARSNELRRLNFHHVSTMKILSLQEQAMGKLHIKKLVARQRITYFIESMTLVTFFQSFLLHSTIFRRLGVERHNFLEVISSVPRKMVLTGETVTK